ncbi:hypothetical protein BDW75DRAFT_38768 [Aspergillus navahoensis]
MEFDVPILPVDYSNVDSLRKVLENNIDAIISTVPITDDAASEAQLNLIEAAIKAPSTRRFIPCDFGIQYNESYVLIFIAVGISRSNAKSLQTRKGFPAYPGKTGGSGEAEETSGLQYTLVSNGFFMDYYGLTKVQSYLRPFVFAVDVANNTAAIPGSGDVHVVFTHTIDVAKYVTGEFDLPDTDTLNKRFPEIKPLAFCELLEKACKA